MQNRPDLTQLSPTQKDELIRMLWPLQQQVAGLMAQVVVMQDRIKPLEGRLALNSKNSSKPPSSDGLNKPAPKSLRVAGQKPTGGQKGHPGSTLCQATQPNKIVIHGVPEQCQTCQRKLTFVHVSTGSHMAQPCPLHSSFTVWPFDHQVDGATLFGPTPLLRQNQ